MSLKIKPALLEVMAWQKELLLEKETALHKILAIRKKAALLRDSLAKNKQPVNKKMSLPQFQRKFATEKECAEYLFRLRWPDGFLCPRCNHPQYYAIKGRHLYQCANPECRYQASVTAGTVLHKTRTPLRIWFWAIYLMTRDKGGCSASALADKLGIRYPKAWAMLHKIRKAMGERDARYLLCDLVEMDNVLLDIPLTGDKGGNKNGGHENDGHENGKVPVIVGVALGTTGYLRHIKMRVVREHEHSATGEFVQRVINEGSVIPRVSVQAYDRYAGQLPWYQQKCFMEIDQRRFLNRIRMAVSKAEAFLAETYHKLSVKHLQAYLDEFCYRYCRRREWGQLFNRLLTACALTGPVTYAELMKQ
ncbi:MAG: IS1595 family transposase [Bacillota bacterium]